MHYRLTLFLFLALLFFSCSQVDSDGTVKPKLSKKAQESQIQLREQQIEEMQKEARILLDSLKSREIILQAKEAKLDSMENELRKWDIKLSFLETRLEKLKIIATVVLVAGILFFIAGLILIFKKKKTKSILPVKVSAPIQQTQPAENPAIIHTEKPKTEPVETPAVSAADTLKTDAQVENIIIETVPAKSKSKSKTAAEAKAGSVKKATPRVKKTTPEELTKPVKTKKTSTRKKADTGKDKKSPDENKNE